MLGDLRHRLRRTGTLGLREAHQRGPLFLVGDGRQQGARRQAIGIEEIATAVDQSHDRWLHPTACTWQDAQQLAADLPHTEQNHIKAIVVAQAAAADLVELELVVHHARRSFRIALGNDHRDVEFTRTLRNRHDVHRRPRQRREHAGGNAGGPRHAEAHDGERGHTSLHIQTFEFTAR